MPVAAVKYPDTRPPPSTGPRTCPAMRQRVRTMRHGSSELNRNTSAAAPSAAMPTR